MNAVVKERAGRDGWVAYKSRTGKDTPHPRDPVEASLDRALRQWCFRVSQRGLSIRVSLGIVCGGAR